MKYMGFSIKRLAKDFLINEEGKVPKKNFLKFGIMALAVVSMSNSVNAGGAHCNNLAHCNHACLGTNQGWEIIPGTHTNNNDDGANAPIGQNPDLHLNQVLPSEHSSTGGSDDCDVRWEGWGGPGHRHASQGNHHVSARTYATEYCDYESHFNELGLTKMSNNEIVAEHQHSILKGEQTLSTGMCSAHSNGS